MPFANCQLLIACLIEEAAVRRAANMLGLSRGGDMAIRSVVLSCLLISVWPLRAQTPDLANVTKLFDYDQKAPLDLQQKSVEDRHGVQVHDISFLSPMGGRVSAYLVTPPGKGPFAGIV